jgi:hypothetical protein
LVENRTETILVGLGFFPAVRLEEQSRSSRCVESVCNRNIIESIRKDPGLGIWNLWGTMMLVVSPLKRESLMAV